MSTARERAASAGQPLSPREFAALQAFAATANRHAAARRLGVSDDHLRELLIQAYRKLEVRNGIAAFLVLGWLVPTTSATGAQHLAADPAED